MIAISEHEQILNSELAKATQEAQDKLGHIQTQMQEMMQKQLSERLTDCQKLSEEAMI